MTSADSEILLTHDYDRTTDLLRALTDVRFKLLAFVPSVSGAAVAVLSRSPGTGELIAVGLIGLTATLGITLYEVRNTQIYDYALQRAETIESRLRQLSDGDQSRPGGLYTERPGRDLRVFGFALAAHDRSLALVYSASMAGWSYLVAWGALHALGVDEPQKLGGAVGIVCGLVVLLEFLRIHGGSVSGRG